MSLSSSLRGALIDAYLGQRSQTLRRGARRAGQLLGRRERKLVFFHRVDDPHSHLLLQLLPALLRSYSIGLEMVLVGAPAPDADPEPSLRARLSLRDASELSRWYELEFPAQPTQPDATRVRRALATLLVDRPIEIQLELAIQAGQALFGDDGAKLSRIADEQGFVPGQEVSPRLEEGARRLQAMGHYQGGTLAYAGEWYGGVDRIRHLQDRLSGEGLEAAPLLRRRDPAPTPTPHEGASLEIFSSFRSPYSYLAIEKLRRLEGVSKLPLRFRPVLPMVTRGLSLPRAKKLYIVRDAKREADRLGIPFGRICDPLGEGVERLFAIFPLADAQGKALEYLSAAGLAVWAQARDLRRDPELRALVESVGLEWAQAREALEDESWRAIGDANRLALRELGLWGVPSFRIDDYCTWGQDRLWLALARVAPR
ncbi:MAG: DsbA family protein [Myxococcales bacterium]|nr:DsbA family protein [Myxococcales bacterium]